MQLGRSSFEAPEAESAEQLPNLRRRLLALRSMALGWLAAVFGELQMKTVAVVAILMAVHVILLGHEIADYLVSRYTLARPALRVDMTA